ncbi:MAG TPA: hypothetical protein VIP09_03055 [Dehalococcoidia bacterium]|jgi:hypothetical protein
MTPTAISTNEVLGLLWRVVMLDATAFQELRDTAHLTLIAAGGLVAAVVIAGFGAWLYSHTVLEGEDFSFVKTVLLGSLFTLILFGAGFGITYVALTTLLRIDIAPDALFRLLAAGYLPYALGLFVCIPELGFVFGLLSVIAVFYWSLFALRAALPAASELHLAAAVIAGMCLWAVMIPFISGPGNEFVTGVFVYGLIA